MRAIYGPGSCNLMFLLSDSAFSGIAAIFTCLGSLSPPLCPCMFRPRRPLNPISGNCCRRGSIIVVVNANARDIFSSLPPKWLYLSFSRRGFSFFFSEDEWPPLPHLVGKVRRRELQRKRAFSPLPAATLCWKGEKG